MDDSAAMGVEYGVGEAFHNPHGLGHGESITVLFDEGGKGFSLHIFLGHINDGIVQFALDEADDIGMIQLAIDLDFAFETVAIITLCREIAEQSLESDKVFRANIEGQMNDTHPAVPNAVDEIISLEELACLHGHARNRQLGRGGFGLLQEKIIHELSQASQSMYFASFEVDAPEVGLAVLTIWIVRIEIGDQNPRGERVHIPSQ